MDLNRIARDRIAAEARRLGTFAVEEGPDGRPLFRLLGGAERGRTFNTYRELKEELTKMQFRTREVFGQGVERPPGAGWYRYPWLEAVARAWEEEVASRPDRYGAGAIAQAVREGWGVDGPEGSRRFADAIMRGGKFFGLPIMDDENASVLRLGAMAGGEFRELEHHQVTEFLERTLGLRYQLGAKLDKRLKALMSMRGIGSVQMGATYKVGAFDRVDELTRNLDQIYGRMAPTLFGAAPDEDLIRQLRRLGIEPGAAPADILSQVEELRRQTKNLGERMTEGQLAIRESAILAQADDMERQALEIEQRHAGSQDWLGIQERRRAADLREHAKRLRDGARQGRVFGNTRIMGLDVHSLETGRNLDLNGQIKGNVHVISDKVMDRLAPGMDVITAVQNIKKDVSMSRARLFTLELEGAQDVLLDVMSMSSFPQFFPPERLAEEARRQFSEAVDAAVPFERQGKAMLAMARRMEAMRPDELADPREAARLAEAQGYARRIREWLEMGLDVRDNPGLMRQFLLSQRSMQTRLRKGVLVPRLPIPDAIAGGIMTSVPEMGVEAVGEGRVAWDPLKETWVMGQRTFAGLYEAFGGADLDDTIVGLLRLNQEGKLKAVMYRRPNALAEFAVLDINPEDTWVGQVLKSKGLEGFSEYETLQRQAQSLQRQIGMLRPARVSETWGVAAATHLRGTEQELEQVRGRMMAWLQAHRSALETIDTSGLSRIGPFAEVDKYGVLRGSDERVRYFRAVDPEAERVAAEIDAITDPAEKARRIQSWYEGRMSAFREGKAALGPYANFRMVMDSWLNQTAGIGKTLTPDQLARARELGYSGVYRLLRQEDAIDASILASGLQVEVGEGEALRALFGGEVTGDVRQVGGRWVRNISLGDVQAETVERMVRDIVALRQAGVDVGLDPWMVENKLKKSGAYGKALDAFDVVRREQGLNYTFKSLLLSPDDPRAHASRLAAVQRELLQEFWGEEILDELGQPVAQARLGGRAAEAVRNAPFPSWLMNRPETMRYRATAQEFLDFYRVARERNKIGRITLDEAWAGAFDDLDELPEGLRVDRGALHAELLDYVGQWFEKGPKGERVAGREAWGRLWAIQALIHEQGRGYELLSMGGEGVNLADLFLKSVAHAKWTSGEEITDVNVRSHLEQMVNERVTLDDLRLSSTAKREELGLAAARSATSAGDAADAVAAGRRRLGALGEGIRELWNVRANRYIAAGTGVLAALGIVRQASLRRDRTPEELHGAPELPGGMPYLGPLGNNFSYANLMDEPVQNGIVYDIRTRGGGVEDFLNEARYVSGADTLGGSLYPTRSLESPNRRRDRILAEANR